MKKRSLFAAVAMLIVSAIVLTSATYAWFSTQADASVEKVVAEVSKSDEGNVLVKNSSDGADGWTTTLEADDLYDGDTELAPVDFAPTLADQTSIYSCGFDGVNYTPSEGGSIIQYSWDVKAVNYEDGDNISITVNWGNTGSAVMYGALIVDSATLYKFGPASYNSFANANFTAVEKTAADNAEGEHTYDGNLPNVIDANEASVNNVLSAVSGFSQNEITLSLGASSIHTIQCFIWCEGQNSNCKGTVSVDDAGFTFSDIALA